MEHRLARAVLLTWVAMFTAVGNASAQEEEVEVPRWEIEEAQAAARRFVVRMQQTRDVSALIDELFLPDFSSHFVSGDCECISLSLYSELSAEERLRWFVATNNFSYLGILDVIHGPPRNPAAADYLDSTFESIVPGDVAQRLRKLITQENDFRIADRQAFQNILASAEKVLAEARGHLVRQGIEQTPEFQKELRDEVTGRDIGYRVRAYAGGTNVKDCEPLVGFPAGQIFYRVETPLMMGVVLTRHGGQMKIVRLTIVDGD